jgi:hypothetical protein
MVRRMSRRGGKAELPPPPPPPPAPAPPPAPEPLPHYAPAWSEETNTAVSEAMKKVGKGRRTRRSKRSRRRSVRGGVEVPRLNLVENARQAVERLAQRARDAAANRDVAPAPAERTKFIAGHGFITYAKAAELGKEGEWNSNAGSRSRRRRGGHSDLKTRRQGMVKAVLHEARERAKAEQRRQVMERVHKKGMEMLARRKTNSATSR